MESFVHWWCELIGVTSPYAVIIATGVVAGGTLLLAAYVIIFVFFAIIKIAANRSAREQLV